ncbi:hypothetical protein Micbo1qcDRAFT_180831 [Microdochium bolleyi]|uniref:Uncharacterized protein n=1 Tax=Microdochium bolleyi TaxID=196109 RepID=A0A136IKA2_9PEZI|nr:hypothetical protein Micbo1qcDRAFT_180831 [Microdochium bolleyi]
MAQAKQPTAAVQYPSVLASERNGLKKSQISAPFTNGQSLNGSRQPGSRPSSGGSRTSHDPGLPSLREPSRLDVSAARRGHDGNSGHSLVAKGTLTGEKNIARAIAPNDGSSSSSETSQVQGPGGVVQGQAQLAGEGPGRAGSPNSACVAENLDLASSGGLARAAIPTSNEPRARASAPQSNLAASSAVCSMDTPPGTLQREPAENAKSSAPGEVVTQPSTHQEESMSEQPFPEGHKMSLGSVLQEPTVLESRGSKRTSDEGGSSPMTKRQRGDRWHKGDGIKIEVSRPVCNPFTNLTLTKDSTTDHIKYSASWVPSFVPPSSFRCDEPWNRLKTLVLESYGEAGMTKLYEAVRRRRTKKSQTAKNAIEISDDKANQYFTPKGYPTYDIVAFHIDHDKEERLRVLVKWQDTEVELKDLEIAGLCLAKKLTRAQFGGEVWETEAKLAGFGSAKPYCRICTSNVFCPIHEAIDD